MVSLLKGYKEMNSTEEETQNSIFLQSYCFPLEWVLSSIRDISSNSFFKFNLFSHYLSKLHSDFDVDRMRSWKTFCSYKINCCS